MFYSHEILTDRQYGVATIWIVATIGSRSQTKRVTRKAIQEVEIDKAVEKIIEPGAPIALRLQGSLLYGVSGVFKQQCQYLLTDAQKVNFHMNTFFKNMTRNEIAPGAGLGRRENLMLMDDPDFASGFIPQMPAFNANADMFLVNSNGRNNTQKTSSQMSPPSLTPGSGSASSQDRFHLQLDVPRSDTLDHNSLHQGLQGLSSGQKPAPLGGMGDICGEEEFGASSDWGLNVDEDGNVVESAAIEPAIFGEDLELPPMPSIEGDNLPQLAAQQPKMDEQGDIIMDEQPLPDVEALPQAQRDDQKAYEQTSPEAENQGATTQRKRKRRIFHPDERLEISRNVLRDWQNPDVYRENCCKPKRHHTTATEARKNAIHLTFGLGLANIGQNLGIPGMIHPLAIQYSGDFLFTATTGLEVFNDQDQGGRKHLRSASEDIEDPEGEGRRVRPRLEEQGEAEQAQLHRGRGDQNGDKVFGLGDDGLSEVGRERQPALDDPPSSMPWNRHSSAMPGSSVRGQPPQFGRDQPSSPLNKRAGSVQDIVRYSDSGDVGGGDFDVGFGSVGGDSNGSGSDQGFPPLSAGGGDNNLDTQQRNQRNQHAREFLDREGANFLSYMEQTIAESGERRHDEDFEKQRKWVGFDDVFVPARTDRATAAQAFYHVLGLVTKGRMAVEQVGMPQEPFGEIHVGVKIDPGS
ncbi:hypothetical protein PG994_004722 [Apiospora phragmitis]|uniref:Rad21/Rec8-like protein N-terminal domain-containing protein n=1 Tax=Apiospora phragmitis TaxID=2905665 RepID=A0ABR1VRH8_9PEZI